MGLQLVGDDVWVADCSFRDGQVRIFEWRVVALELVGEDIWEAGVGFGDGG